MFLRRNHRMLKAPKMHLLVWEKSRMRGSKRRSLPAVLGGLGISEAKQKDAEGSEDQISNLGEH